MDQPNKKTLVLGASANPERYSFLAINKLRKNGHPVMAIGKKTAKVADVDVVTEQKPAADIDTVTLYLNASNQKEYYNYILSLKPKRIIFNPGAENEELETLARA
ncbi:MAG: CoA-binding protein, partial [Bacteroidota bacterium]